jgi:hypothetical protein
MQTTLQTGPQTKQTTLQTTYTQTPHTPQVVCCGSRPQTNPALTLRVRSQARRRALPVRRIKTTRATIDRVFARDQYPRSNCVEVIHVHARACARAVLELCRNELIGIACNLSLENPRWPDQTLKCAAGISGLEINACLPMIFPSLRRSFDWLRKPLIRLKNARADHLSAEQLRQRCQALAQCGSRAASYDRWPEQPGRHGGGEGIRTRVVYRGCPSRSRQRFQNLGAAFPKKSCLRLHADCRASLTRPCVCVASWVHVSG